MREDGSIYTRLSINASIFQVASRYITIEWQKPEYDGGSTLTGYNIEKRELPNGRWVKANFGNVAETHFKIDGLTENTKYEFRVFAKNAIGNFWFIIISLLLKNASILNCGIHFETGTVSEASEVSSPVLCRDELEPPSIEYDHSLRDIQIVRAGDTAKFMVRIYGKPPPSVRWRKDERDIEVSPRVKIEHSTTHTSLTIADTTKNDTGLYKSRTTTTSRMDGHSDLKPYSLTLLCMFCKGPYSVSLSNDAGERSMAIQLKVLDVPGPVRHLTVENVTANKCTVTWDAPSEDGGSDITNYVVEKRETSRVTWTHISSDVQTRYIKVGHLMKDKEYVFR